MLGKNYFLLFVAFLTSLVGGWVYRMVIPIMVFELTKSAMAMAITYAITYLPYILATPFGGVIADWFDRRSVLIYGDILACIFVLILAVSESLGARSTAPIYPIVFIIATISAIYHPAFQSIIPAIVARHHLPKANAYMQTANNVVDLAGPIFGGGAITIIGSEYAIYLTAATFAISAVLIMTIKYREPIGASVGNFNAQAIVRDLREGVGYAWSNPIVRYACVLFLFSNLAIQIFYANFMFFLVDVLRLAPREIGITLSLSGLGAIIGALCAPYASARFAAGRIILSCTICAGLSTLLLLCAKGPLSVALAWGTVAAFNSVIIVVYFTLRQRSVPSRFLGRTVAVTRLVSYAAIPIASLLGGGLLQEFGSIELLIILSALIMTIGGTLGWLTPLGSPTNLAVGDISVPNGETQHLCHQANG